MKRGTIVEFQGSWMSGLAWLTIETEEGIDAVYCDNGCTGRMLDDAFDCATDDHCIDNEKIHGKKIFYETDAFGMLESFTPIELLDEDTYAEFCKELED